MQTLKRRCFRFFLLGVCFGLGGHAIAQQPDFVDRSPWIDGVIIDWHGLQEFRDYPMR